MPLEWIYNFQTCRTVPRSSTKKDCVIAVGGAPRLKSDPVSCDVAYFDPQNNTWGTFAHMREPRHHHAGTVSKIPFIDLDYFTKGFTK